MGRAVGDPAFSPRVIRYEDPPPRHRANGRADWQPVADELRKHPYRWALLYQTRESDAESRKCRGISSNINAAALTAFQPAGSFESVTRMRDDTVSVYARYVGNLTTGELVGDE